MILEDLAEQENLGQVVGGHDSGTANTTESLRASALSERRDTLYSEDLATSVDERTILDGLEHPGQHLKTLNGGLSSVK